MKTNELKPMTWYARGSTWTIKEGTAVPILVLDNHLWHRPVKRNHNDPEPALVKGRAATQGRNVKRTPTSPYWDTEWKNAVASDCGVPCLMPTRRSGAMPILPDTEWEVVLMNASSIYEEWTDEITANNVERTAQAEAAKADRLRAEAENERVRIRVRTLLNDHVFTGWTQTVTVVPFADNELSEALSNYIEAVEAQRAELAEMLEEYKDLLYEMED